MTDEQRDQSRPSAPRRRVTPVRMLGALTVTVLVAAAVVVGTAPPWLAVVVAVAAAVLLALRRWRDRRHGQRWF